MKKLFLLSALFVYSSFNFCPTPLTHHYFAFLFLSRMSYTEEESRAFLAGNQLPDIRYLVDPQTNEPLFPREQTHPKVASLEEVINCTNPYRAGLLFHSYIDVLRLPVVDEQFGDGKWRIALDKYGARVDGAINSPSRKGVPRNFNAFLKFAEEEVLSQYLPSAMKKLYENVYKNVTSETYAKQLGLTISQDIVKLWHERIMYFLTHRPREVLIDKPEILKGHDPELLQNWGPIVAPFSRDPAARDYVSRFGAVFMSQLSESLRKIRTEEE